ncbi:hypothetical protein BG006_003426 [Podila minutissima]|uniref:Uncharacterized protein n=1 Tax=Podila minutissima TaxID=64525 RepID=A0A9P5S940_9FUNG|nr:hypothetical protein BG006_003426 [Podila minutissima]
MNKGGRPTSWSLSSVPASSSDARAKKDIVLTRDSKDTANMSTSTAIAPGAHRSHRALRTRGYGIKEITQETALALRTHGSWDAIDAATSGTIYWLHKEFTARITDIDLPDFGTAFKSLERIDTTDFIHATNGAVAAVETEPENTAEAHETRETPRTPETPETPRTPEMPETPEATAVLFIDSEALVAAGSTAQEEQEGVDNGSNIVLYL